MCRGEGERGQGGGDGDAYEVGSYILFETARDETSRGVGAGEEMITASWTVVAAAQSHVVDGAVDGEKDGFRGIGPIVGF